MRTKIREKCSAARYDLRRLPSHRVLTGSGRSLPPNKTRHGDYAFFYFSYILLSEMKGSSSKYIPVPEEDEDESTLLSTLAGDEGELH